ncbi:MAG: transporter substrate-binding domain-containing protein [Halarcobacter ebronensis]
MKHIIKLFFIFLFITTSLYSSDKITLTKKEKEFIKKHPIIKVGIETNWPPFEFVEEGEYKGLTKGYLDIISQQTGIKFQYIIDDSWSNLLQKPKLKKLIYFQS